MHQQRARQTNPTNGHHHQLFQFPTQLQSAHRWFRRHADVFCCGRAASHLKQEDEGDVWQRSIKDLSRRARVRIPTEPRPSTYQPIMIGRFGRWRTSPNPITAQRRSAMFPVAAPRAPPVNTPPRYHSPDNIANRPPRHRHAAPTPLPRRTHATASPHPRHCHATPTRSVAVRLPTAMPMAHLPEAWQMAASRADNGILVPLRLGGFILVIMISVNITKMLS